MQVRIILRNLGGKFCWDSSILYSLKNDSTLTRQAKPPPPLINTRAFQRDELMTSSFIGGDGAVIQPSPPRLSVRHRPPNSMPNWEDTAEDMDNLKDLLLFIGHTSPECIPAGSELIRWPHHLRLHRPCCLNRRKKLSTHCSIRNTLNSIFTRNIETISGNVIENKQ